MNILEYENYQEKITLSDPDFAYITYLCSIPLDFPQVPLHWHDEMEFIYVKKGIGMVSVDFQPYVVEAGSIILILPGQLHAIDQLGDACMEYENIIFHPNILISKTADSCNTNLLLPFINGSIAVPTHLNRQMTFIHKSLPVSMRTMKLEKPFRKVTNSF